MKQIKPEKITIWGVAKKTKGLKAKPLISIMVDKSITNKFLVDTLEGKEPLGDGAIICIGEANDIWQQMPARLLQKYDVVAIDSDGWMVCEPKPDASVECVEITESIVGIDNVLDTDLFIIGTWGEKRIMNGKTELTQRCELGDFICRNRTDHSDVWIVNRKIFNNTYNQMS